MRRPYHTFRGFDIGLKAPTKWIALPDHGFCPYCSEWGCKQIGTVTYESEVFSLWRCVRDECSKLHEGKEDTRRQLYIRYETRTS